MKRDSDHQAGEEDERAEMNVNELSNTKTDRGGSSSRDGTVCTDENRVDPTAKLAGRLMDVSRQRRRSARQILLQLEQEQQLQQHQQQPRPSQEPSDTRKKCNSNDTEWTLHEVARKLEQHQHHPKNLPDTIKEDDEEWEAAEDADGTSS